MTTCPVLIPEMLPNRVPVFSNDDINDLKTAKKIADQKAAELADDPMLISWYEAQSGRFSPDVECCDEKKPVWVVYAESRGGNLSIDINNQAYVFIYTDVNL